MTTIKVPSSVVPIDVSGQPFSRMASFRRSLIHVDFFIRRKKKKDKRRNTVTEGDTKELKDVLHNILNEECQHAVVPSFKFERNTSESVKHHNLKLQNENNKMNKITNEEKNNNSSDLNTPSIHNIKNCIELDVNSEEKNKVNTTKNESMVKQELKSQTEVVKPWVVNKRKLKSHIPISTVSAAMNVAVKMRQLNGKQKLEDQSSSGNWSNSSDINSSDSENKTNSSETSRDITTELNGTDSSISDGKVYKNRYGEKSGNSEEPNSTVNKETLSCTSSDNNTGHDDATSNGTSAESDVFFISSDESEDSSEIIFEHNYGSSLSLSTVSDGSLNSLLSQTGTEMASSTGTLTSVGLERLPTPPPPPPAIVAATLNDGITTTDGRPIPLDKDGNLQKQEKVTLIQSSSKLCKKSKSSLKGSKPRKTEKVDLVKHSTENTKNIFSTLVNIKSKTKEQKHKSAQIKVTKQQNQPHFNMYGSSSPKNVKPMPLFLKENVSPVKEKEPRNYLQSFSSNQNKLESSTQLENKPKVEKTEYQGQHNTDSQVSKTHATVNNADALEFSKAEVPLKYAHKVTVTPIQRQTVSERNKSMADCKKSLFRDDQQQIVDHCNEFKNKINIQSSDLNNELYHHEKPKPQRPRTLQSDKPKLAARVLLDPEGRVIQCTNSLDRKLYSAVPAECYGNSKRTNLMKYPINRDFIKNKDGMNFPHCTNQSHYLRTPAKVTPEFSIQHSMTNRPSSVSEKMDYRFNNQHAMVNNRPNSIAVVPNERRKIESHKPVKYYPNFLTTPPCQNRTEILHSQVVTGNQNRIHVTESQCPNMMRTLHQAKSVHNHNSNEVISSNFYPNTTAVIPPNPNIPGLPLNETMLTKHNIKLHSKQMERLCISSSEGDNCTKGNSYTSSEKSSHNLINTEAHKSQQSTMSTEDLFAVIHNCKKRMNIKTDSDISLASSSRSNSPSCLRPVPSKGALAETGFLSPRNLSSFDSSRDRRSWADFRPTNGSLSERKSLASDRLGPIKPTSMHDFKMLLLQTRSNSQVLGPRKSAVEMLKVPSPQEGNPRINSAPLNLSSNNCMSYSVPNSPSSEQYLYNGHSTVPFKRNNRARSSLQLRYTMYPPIFEDCSEDSENSKEILQNCSETSASDSEQIKNNAQLQREKYNVNNNLSENTIQNLRLWL